MQLFVRDEPLENKYFYVRDESYENKYLIRTKMSKHGVIHNFFIDSFWTLFEPMFSYDENEMNII